MLLALVVPATLPAALPNLFARFTVDRNGLYVGEPFYLTLSIHVTEENLDKPVAISEMPTADSLRLETFQELPVTQETLEGRTYETRRFRCRAAALQRGTITLAPSLQGTLIRETRSYFFVQRQPHPVIIPVTPLTLNILPLPDAGRPTDFSGAVGRFSLRATATPRDVAPGDLVTITLEIDGDGLPDPFAPPRVAETPGLKAYEMKPVPDESSAMHRVFRQTVVPMEPSLRAIPPLTFSFFDARAGAFRTLAGGPFPLTFHAERAPVASIYTPPPTSHTSGLTAARQPLPHAARVGWLEWSWNRIQGRQPAAIGPDAEVSLHVGPSEASKVLLSLKPGTTVFRDAPSHAGWVRVHCREGIGWLQESQLQP